MLRERLAHLSDPVTSLRTQMKRSSQNVIRLFLASTVIVMTACSSHNPTHLVPRRVSIAEEAVHAELRSARGEQAVSQVSQEVLDSLVAVKEVELEKLRLELGRPIYFDDNSHALSDEARDALLQKVAILQANPDVRLRLIGHTAERGGSEYNVALGLRRAQTVQAFFVVQGIEDERLSILSYGKMRVDPDEDAALNRRVDVIVASGAVVNTPK